VSCVHQTNALAALQDDLNAFLHDVVGRPAARTASETRELLKTVNT